MILTIPTQSTASTPDDTGTQAWNSARTYNAIAPPTDQNNYGRFFAMWTRSDGKKIIVSGNSGYFTIGSTDIVFNAAQHPNPNVGTLKFALCAAPAFTVPINARSFTVQNVSGADMWIRSYIPSYAETGHLIDIVPQALTLDDTMVGTLLAHGQTQAYHGGSFTPGQSFVIAAASAATDGCIVEFSY
ncbi:MAG: hypothetical protein E6Q97_25060 [Desulfurellales bacterium]|nr:MAG: hypothetical protein E6Q97_25060 [Desulfurellales bacterium]